MKRYSSTLLLLAALICTIFCAGCGEKKDPTAEAAPPVAADAKKDATVGKPAGQSSAPAAPPAGKDVMFK